jgi:hypothetical protein
VPEDIAKELRRLHAENVRLKAELADALATAELTETHNTMLRVCLKNVIRVADRKTDEFDAARAALGKS